MPTVPPELGAALDDSAASLRAATESLHAGESTLEEWAASMADGVRLAHTAAAVAALGDDAHAGYVNSLVAPHVGHLEGFLEDLASAEPPTPAQAAARAELYARSAFGTYQNALRDGARASGLTLERRVLNPGKHCDECLAAAAMGWQPLGTLPPIGRSSCGPNCNCEFRFKAAGEETPPPGDDADFARRRVPKGSPGGGRFASEEQTALAAVHDANARYHDAVAKHRNLFEAHLDHFQSHFDYTRNARYAGEATAEDQRAAGEAYAALHAVATDHWKETVGPHAEAVEAAKKSYRDRVSTWIPAPRVGQAERNTRSDNERYRTRHMANVASFAFDPSKHPRGQPGNAGEFGPGGVPLEAAARSAHAYVRENGPSRKGELAEHLRDEHGLEKPHALAAVAALHAAGYLTREPGVYDDRPVYDRGRAPGEGTGESHAFALDVHGDTESRPAAGLFAAPGRAEVEDRAIALMRSAGVRQASLTFRPAKGLTVIHDRGGIRAAVTPYEDDRGLGVEVSEALIGGKPRRAVVMPDTPPDVAEYRLRRVLRLPVPKGLRARLAAAGGLPDVGFSAAGPDMPASPRVAAAVRRFWEHAAASFSRDAGPDLSGLEDDLLGLSRPELLEVLAEAAARSWEEEDASFSGDNAGGHWVTLEGGQHVFIRGGEVQATREKIGGVAPAAGAAPTARDVLVDSGLADRADLTGATPSQAAAIVEGVRAGAAVAGKTLRLRSVEVVDRLPVGKDEGGLGYSAGRVYVTTGFLKNVSSHGEDTKAKGKDFLKGTGAERNVSWEDADSPAEAIKMGVAHEMGHHVSTALLLDVQKGVRDAKDAGADLSEAEVVKLSGYSSDHPEEMFAEAHSFVVTGREHKLPPGVREFYHRAIATADPEPIKDYVRGANDAASFSFRDQPRVPAGSPGGGRWAGGVSPGTAAARDAASDAVRAFARGQGSHTAADAEALAGHLARLTVAQIHTLRKEHGLKGSAPNKAALVAKLAGRLAAWRAGRAPKEAVPNWPEGYDIFEKRDVFADEPVDPRTLEPKESPPVPAAKEPWQQTRKAFVGSGAGRHTRGLVHGDAIKQAILAGKEVPERVLRDYPGFAERVLAEREAAKNPPPDPAQAERDRLAEWSRKAVADPTSVRAHDFAHYASDPAADKVWEYRQDGTSRSGHYAEIHRKAVEAAVLAGKPVPPEVLADYPDLAPKAAPPPPAPSPPPPEGKPIGPEHEYALGGKKVKFHSGEYAGMTGTVGGIVQRRYGKEDVTHRIQMDGFGKAGGRRGGWDGQITATHQHLMKHARMI